MEKYLVVYDAGTKIAMTKEEVQKFLIALNSKDIVEFKGQFLTKFFKVIVRDDPSDGRLHDGTRVVKKFGIWVDKFNPGVNLDPKYYPEITKDIVFTDEEFEKVSRLSPADRLVELLTGKNNKIEFGKSIDNTLENHFIEASETNY